MEYRRITLRQWGSAAKWLLISIPLVCMMMAGPAVAHSEKGEAIDFWSGFTHPLFGLDHVVAMVAVGLWGAFLGAPALWILPVVFPLVMAIAGAAGVFGLPLVGIETGIALSAIALGAMVAFAAKPPLWVAALLVGGFAVFHGYAHGAELPVGADRPSMMWSRIPERLIASDSACRTRASRSGFVASLFPATSVTNGVCSRPESANR